jgi:hypothetical protein
MRLLVLVAVLALAACGQQQAYPPGYEMNFMSACEQRSAIPGQCACVWDKIETEVPADEFAALDQMPGPQREAHPLMQQINGYSLACANELQREQPATP